MTQSMVQRCLARRCAAWSGAAFCAVTLLVVTSVGPAMAVTQYQKSLYTTIDRQACKALAAHGVSAAYECPGLVGFPIYLAENAGHTFVAASTEPDKAQAAGQTLAAHNTPFSRKTNRATVEWRFTINGYRSRRSYAISRGLGRAAVKC